MAKARSLWKLEAFIGGKRPIAEITVFVNKDGKPQRNQYVSLFLGTKANPFAAPILDGSGKAIVLKTDNEGKALTMITNLGSYASDYDSFGARCGILAISKALPPELKPKLVDPATFKRVRVEPEGDSTLYGLVNHPRTLLGFDEANKPSAESFAIQGSVPFTMYSGDGNFTLRDAHGSVVCDKQKIDFKLPPSGKKEVLFLFWGPKCEIKILHDSKEVYRFNLHQK